MGALGGHKARPYGVANSMEFLPDRVIPAASDQLVELWIYSAYPKTGWVAHSKGNRARVDHPGSAIKYQAKIYELLRVEETSEAGYQYRYGLKAWDAQHAIRHLVNYTLESQRDAAAAHWDAEKAERLRNLILWLFPLAGFAPDPLQREWSAKTGLSMGWIAAASAVFGCISAFILRGMFAGSYWTAGVLYLALESFARLLWIALSQAPHGSLLLTFAYIAWQAFSGARPAAEGHNADLIRQCDEVILDPDGKSLRVRSCYFDTTLAGPAPVSIEGATYRPIRWLREGIGLSRRWVYELEKADTPPGSPCREYSSPRAPDRQEAVEQFTRKLDLAQSFALFWGVYPRRDQLRLQVAYQHDAARATALTAGLFLVTGLVPLCVAVGLYRASILALTGPVYLTVESAYRLYRARVRAQPAGSIVGYALRLVIHPPA